MWRTTYQYSKVSFLKLQCWLSTCKDKTMHHVQQSGIVFYHECRHNYYNYFVSVMLMNSSALCSNLLSKTIVWRDTNSRVHSCSTLFALVPRTVLLYVPMISSSHVPWAFSLMSSIATETEMVRLNTSNRNEAVVWLLKKWLLWAPNKASAYWTASVLQDPGSPNKNRTPMCPQWRITSYRSI